ncbi:hypothetical protein [Ancylobacter sp. G4_0304]|uniref:hypothetical protein n=1 Tax=Ancylobacter sp. G4_0304 TaxID=3114289 RepID=UPI0039C6E928
MSVFNWKTTLTATALSLAAAGLTTTALANAPAYVPGTGYEASRTTSGATASAPRAPGYQGRNAYVNERPTFQLETYIRRQIEMDKRS